MLDAWFGGDGRKNVGGKRGVWEEAGGLPLRGRVLFGACKDAAPWTLRRLMVNHGAAYGEADSLLLG